MKELQRQVNILKSRAVTPEHGYLLVALNSITEILQVIEHENIGAELVSPMANLARAVADIIVEQDQETREPTHAHSECEEEVFEELDT